MDLAKQVGGMCTVTAGHIAAIPITVLLVRLGVWLRREVLPMRRLARNLRVLPQGLLIGVDDVVEWGELLEVRVETTGDGPWEPDLFLVLVSRGRRTIRIPSEILPGDLIGRLQELPGFDYGPFIAACGCAEKATFVCWRRAPAARPGRAIEP